MAQALQKPWSPIATKRDARVTHTITGAQTLACAQTQNKKTEQQMMKTPTSSNIYTGNCNEGQLLYAKQTCCKQNNDAIHKCIPGQVEHNSNSQPHTNPNNKSKLQTATNMYTTTDLHMQQCDVQQTATRRNAHENL